jgi:Flp pilus assembly protein TadG
MLRGLTREIGRLGHDRRGVSAVEFAVIAPILLMLVLGAYEFGTAAQQQIQLQTVVRAAGAYAVSRPTDVIGIQNAAAHALPAGWTLASRAGVVVVTCSCLNTATGEVARLGACTDATLAMCTGPVSGKLVSITAKMAHTAVTPLFATAIPHNTATYVTRFQ